MTVSGTRRGKLDKKKGLREIFEDLCVFLLEDFRFLEKVRFLEYVLDDFLPDDFRDDLLDDFLDLENGFSVI